ncbi:hypothetical protein BB560_004107 [Smittium megazygosporum]|uniref:Aldehyde dehydrogenase domain-containing protein n=1 Tax=Smittium megazygosporum TaxID=133381 RepID=A0A2T9ZA77_9FUNG|nr:hypothetical protein BB560_004107 [Smittium megazygosporum]
MNSLKYLSKLYVGGKWIASSGSKLYSVINPTSASEICQVVDANTKDVDSAVEAAKAAFETGPWYNLESGASRRDSLLKISHLIEQNKNLLAEVESINTGKIISDSLWEIQDCADLFKFYAGFADKLSSRYVSYGTLNQLEMHTIKEPIGVCGMISSFNYPLNLVSWKIAPALAMGNTVVVKPAPQTPLSLLLFAHLLDEASILPKGVFNVVTGGVEPGAAMVNNPNINKISFTGSLNGGRAVNKSAAASANFKGVTLELGGKSPVVVMDDADLDNAVENIILGIFSNAGMNCSAGSKLYIQKGAYDKLLQLLVKRAQSISQTITSDFKTSSMGPLIDSILMNKVETLVQQAISSKDATLLSGGKRWSGAPGYYYEPTILTNVKQDSPISKTEIFGPVLCVMEPISDLDEVINIESRSEFGLASAIFSSSSKSIHKFKRNMKAGTCWVNMYNLCTPDLPFGGFKNSGFGKELGHEVINEYYTERSYKKR